MNFSIGEFSKMTTLSIKSLRLYHEKGILIPAKVDKFTGYRYYDEANYETAKSIRILKEYDFTLAEIKEMLEECQDESAILEYLVVKLSDVGRKIQRYKEISQQIELTIQHERERAMQINKEFQIEEKEVDTLLIAGYRMKGKYPDIGEGFKILGKAIGRHINGKAMALFYDSEFKETDADFEPCFPVRKGKSSDRISVRELKGGKCVSLIHKGPYETLGESYKKIFAYLNDKGYETLLPSREIYLKGPGMIFKGNANNYLTEIIMPVRDTKGAADGKN
ncbi:MAG: MerR family transcriptional regulator [Calditrichaeota bacterium]|nr:MerR family transcriptional regulator [Calditrichota bacterium]